MNIPFESREQYDLYKAAERHRIAMEGIRPFIKARCDVESLMMPNIMIYADGRMERTYSEKDQQVLDEYDATIKNIFQLLIKDIL